MKKNNGFTLIELIAVIVVLSIIMIISTISINSSLKSARKEEYKILEKQLFDMGTAIYSHGTIFPESDEGKMLGRAKTSSGVWLTDANLEFLYNNEYLKGIKLIDGKAKISDPKANSYCNGYVGIRYNNKKYDFKGFISCKSYETDGYSGVRDF
ncbi:MAG: prepilin-type N-terminal cleavage/methylation domain-containing protein [Bacilli bacterium]